MKKQSQNLILGATLLVVAGAGAFLFTRKAAAADKAKKAFAVDMDCGSFLVLDDDLAKSALIAAAIAVAPSPDSSAIEALKAILAFMFPQCNWSDPPDGRTFVRSSDTGGQHLTWGTIKMLVGDKTVAELRKMLETIGEMQGASPTNDGWLISYVFGTGGCISCAMGTGQRHHSNKGYTGPVDKKVATGARARGAFATAALVGTGDNVWLPASMTSRPPKNKGLWIQLLDQMEGNIYAAILHSKNDRPVQAEMRIVGNNKYEARVL